MSLLAHGVFAFALLGVQEGKGDPNLQQSGGPEPLAYAAFRLESETRDFKAALLAWTKAREAYEKAGRKEMTIKAELGQARCLHALGKHDEAKATLQLVLAAEPRNVEATALLAKLETEARDGDDELKEIVRQLADVALSLTSEQEDERIKSARSDLIRMSDVAVPQLADLLRDNRVGVVEGAATILAQIQTSRAFEAFAAAVNDPRCRYPKIVVGPVVGSGSDLVLPVLAAMLTRTEPEIRRMAADELRNSIGGLPDDAQLDVAKRLLADPDEQIRHDVAYANFSAPVVQLLVPTFQALVASGDETALELGVAFLTKNRERLPADVVARWTQQLMRSPIASVRIWMLDADYQAAKTSDPHGNDPRWHALVLMRFLMDDDAAVFSAGAHKLESDGSLSIPDAVVASRESVVAVLRRTVDLPGVSLANRYAVLMHVALDPLSDDDLFDLFVRLSDRPVDAEAGWRASVRDIFARALLARHDPFERDRIAAARLPAIPDGPGRRVWFDRAISAINTTPAPKMFQVHRAAARLDDKDLRAAAYRFLAANDGSTADALPHVVADLRAATPAEQLPIVRSIRGGSAPELVAQLRAITTNGSGDLHDAALGALAYVGGKEVADELLAAMKATPKDQVFPFLWQLEQTIGAERLAQELIAVAKAHGTSNQVALWMHFDGPRVSSECVTAFVRGLPSELVGSSVMNLLADSLAPDVLAPLICRRLREGKGGEVAQAARMAGDYHVDSAWPDLVALLDTSAGQTRNLVITSLKSLRDYRELRRTFAADDSDARRAAFDKAVAMTKSKNAEQRAGAAIALAATGDVAAISPLLDLLGDGDESVKVAALKALEKLADRAVVMPVDGSRAAGDKDGGKGGDGEKERKKGGS